MPSGGARAGAGRKKGDKHLLRLWVTAEEENAIKKYLAKIREAHKSEAEILAELEKTGQGKLFENTAMKSKSEADNIDDWEKALSRKIKTALRTSKTAATAILTEEVCNTLNKPFFERTERVLSVLAGFVFQLRDKRKKAEDFNTTEEMLTRFLERQGYFQELDIDQRKTRWVQGIKL